MLATCWAVGMGVFLFLGQAAPTGYLFLKPAEQRQASRPKIIAYQPREGDLIFFDDHSRVWNTLFALAGTGPPTHMGIVVKKAAGGLAILEAGPDDSVWVELLDLAPRLRQFQRDFQGTILIRRCKVKLTPEKSAALARFAKAQKGKRYAVLRLLAQGTRFRVRGLMEPLLAATEINRDSWICSELAVAAGTVAGLFDPKKVRSNATYPRDLVDNRRHNLKATWEEPAPWQPGRNPETPASKGKGGKRESTRP